MSAAMIAGDNFSRAPRRMGIACVLTGPPVRTNMMRHRFPFLTDANSHEHYFRYFRTN
ncbi:hypothetical protein VSR68_32795 [Paraburkholderia phymatum]|uniref:hypothetical protein n=1 Tax=Paraburkholderia phymatum TaxID=148447 RepID=UPI00316B24DF